MSKWGYVALIPGLAVPDKNQQVDSAASRQSDNNNKVRLPTLWIVVGRDDPEWMETGEWAGWKYVGGKSVFAN